MCSLSNHQSKSAEADFVFWFRHPGRNDALIRVLSLQIPLLKRRIVQSKLGMLPIMMHTLLLPPGCGNCDLGQMSRNSLVRTCTKTVHLQRVFAPRLLSLLPSHRLTTVRPWPPRNQLKQTSISQ